jgi:hypothetical protein
MSARSSQIEPASGSGASVSSGSKTSQYRSRDSLAPILVRIACHSRCPIRSVARRQLPGSLSGRASPAPYRRRTDCRHSFANTQALLVAGAPAMRSQYCRALVTKFVIVASTGRCSQTPVGRRVPGAAVRYPFVRSSSTWVLFIADRELSMRCVTLNGESA